MKRKLMTGLALFAMSTASYSALAEEGYDNDNYSGFVKDYAECQEYANGKSNNAGISIGDLYHQCMIDRGYEEDELEESDTIYEDDDSDNRG
jgi:ribonuclease PH